MEGVVTKTEKAGSFRKAWKELPLWRSGVGVWEHWEQVWSLAWHSGVRIWHCHNCRFRWWLQLGSGAWSGSAMCHGAAKKETPGRSRPEGPWVLGPRRLCVIGDASGELGGVPSQCSRRGWLQPRLRPTFRKLPSCPPRGELASEPGGQRSSGSSGMARAPDSALPWPWGRPGGPGRTRGCREVAGCRPASPKGGEQAHSRPA